MDRNVNMQYHLLLGQEGKLQDCTSRGQEGQGKMLYRGEGSRDKMQTTRSL